jgi:hypothetical protein
MSIFFIITSVKIAAASQKSQSGFPLAPGILTVYFRLYVYVLPLSMGNFSTAERDLGFSDRFFPQQKERPRSL